MILASEIFWAKFDIRTNLDPSKTADIKLNMSPLTVAPSLLIPMITESSNTIERTPEYDKTMARILHRLSASPGTTKCAITAAQIG